MALKKANKPVHRLSNSLHKWKAFAFVENLQSFHIMSKNFRNSSFCRRQNVMHIHQKYFFVQDWCRKKVNATE